MRCGLDETLRAEIPFYTGRALRPALLSQQPDWIVVQDNHDGQLPSWRRNTHWSASARSAAPYAAAVAASMSAAPPLPSRRRLLLLWLVATLLWFAPAECAAPVRAR